MVKNSVKWVYDIIKLYIILLIIHYASKALIKKKIKFYCPKGLSNLAPAATSDPSGSTSSLGSSVITNWE